MLRNYIIKKFSSIQIYSVKNNKIILLETVPVILIDIFVEYKQSMGIWLS